MHFKRKKIIKKICVPTLPKIFRPFTRNTHIFLFGLNISYVDIKASMYDQEMS